MNDLRNTKPPNIEDTMLLKWFKIILDNSPVDISDEEFQTFLSKDLNVPYSDLPAGLKLTLPTMVSVYMQTWSGWNFVADLKAGQFTFTQYFERFRKYVTYRTIYCIETNYELVLSELRKKNMPIRKLKAAYLKRCDLQKATPDNGDSGCIQDKAARLSPYTLLIKCPSQMMNTLVFSTEGDDVILKHHTGDVWRPLNTHQLIMWPNISVTYLSDDLYFTRSHVTEYNRYLNLLPQECERLPEGLIESVEYVGQKMQRNVYSYSLIEAYVNEYIKKLRLLKHLPADKLEEIEAILTHLLEDIKAIDQDSSIATNTKILFRLSQMSYVRNKKLMQGGHSDKSSNRVGYCEVITPKIELLLKSFKAQQLPTSEIKFESTEQIPNYEKRFFPNLRLILPKVYYKCNFCFKDFFTVHGRRDILEHLTKEHKIEQYVRCTLCKKQFDVLNLTLHRWRHQCSALAN